MARFDPLDIVNQYLRGEAQLEDDEPTPLLPADKSEEYRKVSARLDETPEPAPAPAPKKAVIIEAPAAKPDDADPELDRLQSRARDRKKWGLLGLAASNFADAFTSPGARTSNEFWDKYIKAGDDQVADYRARRQAQEAWEKKRKSQELEQALGDKDSSQSQMARELYGRYLPGADLSSKSAREIISVYGPAFETIIREQGADARDRDRLKAADEKRAAAERALQNQKDAFLAAYGEELKQLGVNAENIELADQETLSRFQTMAEGLRNRSRVAAEKADDIARRRQDSELEYARRQEEIGRREAVEERKNEQDRQKGMPRGWRATGDMTDTQKTRLVNGLVSAERLRLGISDLREKLRSSNRLSPQDRASLRAAVMGLRLEAKNVAELGAITGPDQAYLESLVADPTSFSEMLIQDPQKRLDDLEGWTERQVDAARNTFPIELAIEVERAPATGTAEPRRSPGSLVRMRFPDGSVHEVPADKVDAARRKGGKPL